MPNWVYNDVTIKASAQRCAEIKDALHYQEGSESTVLSFQKIVPRPPEEDDNWYDWNIANWHTKWDACDPMVTVEDDGTLNYSFRTAWSPPMAVIEKFVDTHPDVDVLYHYQEEQGWGGNIEVCQGKLVKHDQYDIPSSHAEIVERNGWCYCQDGNEAYFADCFYEQAKDQGVNDPNVLDAVKGLGSDWHGTFDELLDASEHL